MKKAKKYPALHSSLKSRQWALDYDYLSKLSQEELEFLNDFSAQYYAGDFRSSEPMLDRKTVDDAANARRRDAMLFASSENSVENLEKPSVRMYKKGWDEKKKDKEKKVKKIPR